MGNEAARRSETKATTTSVGVILKRVLQGAFTILVILAITFIPAGRLDWVMGWVFIGSYLVTSLCGLLYLWRIDKGLWEERRQAKEGTKAWDRVLVALYSLASLPITIIVSGLDENFGWSPPMPLYVNMIGLLFNFLAYGLVYWAMASNTFFGTYIRIQKDRGHTAVSGGPYRFIRHPGYVGMIVLALSAPVVLGSLWALIPGALGAGVVLLRTALEDRILLAELDGYEEYAQRVRYRLLPGIW
jgi:protein-S-isoprenylcysteine O-methyltransferase Ste14